MNFIGEKFKVKKAVLSNRIYMNFDEELYEKAKERLTFKIPPKIPGDPPEVKCLLNVIGKKFLSFPIGAQDLIPKDYEIVDKRTLNPVKFPKFKFTLRPSQQKVYDLIDDNCLINANTSWGKTFTCIAIATKLGQKTLIITHSLNLRDQWEKEIIKTLGIKPGIIGSGRVDYKNKPIVVANVQTLNKYTTELKSEFGTVILDEVHHAPATIFEKCIDTSKARYKIGASATLKRKDYLHVVIPYYFSKKIYKPPRENQMTPKVYMIQSNIPFNSNTHVPWANKVNELCDRPEYLDLVTDTAERFANEGHLVLVVSDRVEFLDRCNQRSGDRAVMVTGSTKNRDELHKELKDKNCDILYGSLSIYKEGISLDYLSCLILAAPINNDPLLEQLIGRVLRTYPDKLTPIIVDIMLKGATAKKQARIRAAYYMREKYKITHVDLQ